MSKYVITKLISGEVLVSELVSASQHSITLHRPVQVRLVPVARNNDIAEEPVISIYCQFTSEEDFEFKNDHVVYSKEIIDKLIPFYQKTADGLYNVTVTSINVKEYEGDTKELAEDDTTATMTDFIKNKILH